MNVDFADYTTKGLSKGAIYSIAVDKHYDSVIVNINEIDLEDEELIELIEQLVYEEIGNVCIMGIGCTYDNNIIIGAVNAGVEHFIMYADMESNIQAFVDLINNEPNLTALENFFILSDKKKKKSVKPKETPKADTDTEIATEKEKEEEENTISANEDIKSIQQDIHENKTENVITKTIAVGGCLPRMGATTISIQLVKYLLSVGKRACYVDCTDSDYIESFIAVYRELGELNNEEKTFTLDGIVFYCNSDRDTLQTINEKGYEYVVLDYGCIYQDNAKIRAFSEKDIKLLCAGSQPNEYKAIYHLLDDLQYVDVTYLFYSVAEREKPVISETCLNYNKHCYFTPFIEDVFVLQQDTAEMFGQVFGISNNTQKKKSKFSFGRRKKK